MTDVPLDPSWLPATVATCSATLIAIVGGLVATRRVTVDNERHQAAAELSSRVTATQLAASDLATAEATLRTDETDVWLASEAEYLVDESRQSIDADALLSRSDPTKTPQHSLIKKTANLGYFQARIDEACQIVSRANANVDDHYPLANAAMPARWRLGRSALGSIQETGLSEVIYSRSYARRYIQWRAGQPEGSTVADEVRDLPDAEQTALRHTTPLASTRLKVEQARVDEVVARNAREIAKARADALGKPRSDAALFVVLGLLGAVGVVLPLGMLAWGMDHVWNWLRWLLVAVVGLGVPGILWSLSGRRWIPAAWRRGTKKTGNDQETPQPDGGAEGGNGSGGETFAHAGSATAPVAAPLSSGTVAVASAPDLGRAP